MADSLRLIVVMAFDRDDEGNLVAAFEQMFDSEIRAKAETRVLSA